MRPGGSSCQTQEEDVQEEGGSLKLEGSICGLAARIAGAGPGVGITFPPVVTAPLPHPRLYPDSTGNHAGCVFVPLGDAPLRQAGDAERR